MRNHKPVRFIQRLAQGISVAALFAAQFVWAETYSAVLQWSQRVELGTPLSGVIIDVRVQSGEKVAKGAVLVQLDDQVLLSRVASAQASLQHQEEHYKESQRELKRTTELYNRTLISDHDLQVAKNNEVQAKAEFEKARTALVQAKNNLQYSKVRAPFNALILERNAEVGKVISAELKPEALLVIAESDRMLARIYVDASKLGVLTKGQSAQVRVNDQSFSGTIKAISLEPTADKNSNNAARYAVDIEFSVSDKILRAGLKASVDLP